MANNSNQIGNKIKKILLKKKLKQVIFCEVLGVDKTNVSRLLSGENQISFSHLQKISAELKIQIIITGNKISIKENGR